MAFWGAAKQYFGSQSQPGQGGGGDAIDNLLTALEAQGFDYTTDGRSIIATDVLGTQRIYDLQNVNGQLTPVLRIAGDYTQTDLPYGFAFDKERGITVRQLPDGSTVPATPEDITQAALAQRAAAGGGGGGGGGFAPISQSIQVDPRTGEVVLINPVTGAIQRTGETLGFPGIDPQEELNLANRAQALDELQNSQQVALQQAALLEQGTMSRANLRESARQLGVNAAMRRYEQALNTVTQLSNISLQEAERIQSILRDGTDFVARAFESRGEKSPLARVTQADQINAVRAATDNLRSFLESSKPEDIPGVNVPSFQPANVDFGPGAEPIAPVTPATTPDPTAKKAPPAGGTVGGAAPGRGTPGAAPAATGAMGAPEPEDIPGRFGFVPRPSAWTDTAEGAPRGRDYGPRTTSDEEEALGAPRGGFDVQSPTTSSNPLFHETVMPDGTVVRQSRSRDLGADLSAAGGFLGDVWGVLTSPLRAIDTPADQRRRQMQGYAEGGLTKEPVIAVGEEEPGELGDTGELVINFGPEGLAVIPNKDIPKNAVKVVPGKQRGTGEGEDVSGDDLSSRERSRVLQGFLQAANERATGNRWYDPRELMGALPVGGAGALTRVGGKMVPVADDVARALAQYDDAILATRNAVQPAAGFAGAVANRVGQLAGRIPGFATGTFDASSITEGAQGNLGYKDTEAIADAIRSGQLENNSQVGTSTFNLQGDRLYRQSVFGAPAVGAQPGVASISTQTSRVYTPEERAARARENALAAQGYYDENQPSGGREAVTQEGLISEAQRLLGPGAREALQGRYAKPITTPGFKPLSARLLSTLSGEEQDQLGAFTSLKYNTPLATIKDVSGRLFGRPRQIAAARLTGTGV